MQMERLFDEANTAKRRVLSRLYSFLLSVSHWWAPLTPSHPSASLAREEHKHNNNNNNNNNKNKKKKSILTHKPPLLSRLSLFDLYRKQQQQNGQQQQQAAARALSLAVGPGMPSRDLAGEYAATFIDLCVKGQFLCFCVFVFVGFFGIICEYVNIMPTKC